MLRDGTISSKKKQNGGGKKKKIGDGPDAFEKSGNESQDK